MSSESTSKSGSNGGLASQQLSMQRKLHRGVENQCPGANKMSVFEKRALQSS